MAALVTPIPPDDPLRVFVDADAPAVALRGLVITALETETRANVYDRLHALALEYRARGEEDTEEMVLGTMDALTGFCSTASRL